MDTRNPDALTVTLFVAAALHAIVILGLGFVAPTNAVTAPPSLEVILVQEGPEQTPDEADYIAQISQDGGGESEANDRPSSPFASALDVDSDGVAPIPVEATTPEPVEASAEEALTATFSETEISVDTERESLSEELGRADEIVVEQNLDIARLAAEIDRAQQEFAKRPKKMFIDARTAKAASAEYMKYWVEKVERVGNLNYPDAARRAKLSGALQLTVGIYKNGEIESITFQESSGQKVLDDAARRIVELAGPFQALEGSLAEEVDILYITRTWDFRGDDRVTTY